jgi:hypothetical protein
MTTQQAAPRGTTGRFGSVLALTVASALVIVVATVSVATWQGAVLDGGTEANRPATHRTVGTTASVAGGTTPSAVPTRATALFIYLVASQEQASMLRTAMLEEGAALEATHAQPSRTTQVVWFDSVEAEASFWSVMEGQAQAALGLDPVTVVDLRTPAAIVPPLDPAASMDPELYRRWRQAQAASVPEPISHPDWN